MRQGITNGIVCLVCAFAIACGTEDSGPKTAELAPVSLEAGEEILSICRSRSLNNDQPIYVQSIHMEATPGFHHSGWFVIKDDGTLGDDCGGQRLDLLTLGATGRVLFLQSTQSTDETQTYPQGAGIYIPAHSAVVADLHLINARDTREELKTSLRLDTIAEKDVSIRLNAFVFMYTALNVPAKADSEFIGSCDLHEAQGSPINSNVYFASSHYHYLGTGATLKVMGGAHDGAMIFDGHGRVGEPWGTAIDPAMPLTGANGLTFSCSYHNERDTAVPWGNRSVDEMCAVGGYSDSEFNWVGVVDRDEPMEPAASGDGVVRRHGNCKLFALPPQNW